MAPAPGWRALAALAPKGRPRITRCLKRGHHGGYFGFKAVDQLRQAAMWWSAWSRSWISGGGASRR